MQFLTNYADGMMGVGVGMIADSPKKIHFTLIQNKT